MHTHTYTYHNTHLHTFTHTHTHTHTHTCTHSSTIHIDDPENREWFERYRYDIPVIHLDGKFLMQHRVSEGLLRRALEKSRREKGLPENS